MDASLLAAELDVNARTPAGRKKPGPKPGTRHAGMFQKGHDPRRLEAPRVKRDFQALVKDHADEALQCLLDCVRDDRAPWKERRAASELLIAHAVGTPVNRIVQAQVGGPAAGVDVSKLSNEELLNMALNASENASEALPALEHGPTSTD